MSAWLVYRSCVEEMTATAVPTRGSDAALSPDDLQAVMADWTKVRPTADQLKAVVVAWLEATLTIDGNRIRAVFQRLIAKHPLQRTIRILLDWFVRDEEPLHLVHAVLVFNSSSTEFLSWPVTDRVDVSELPSFDVALEDYQPSLDALLSTPFALGISRAAAPSQITPPACTFQRFRDTWQASVQESCLRCRDVVLGE